MLPEESSNPYIIGPDVQKNDLFGRQEVFDFVRGALLARRQNAVVLHGQRRVGKTSILKEIPHRLPADKFHFVYFDLSGQAALLLNQVLYNLADEIAASLSIERPVEAQFEPNGKFFQTDFLPQVYRKLNNKRLLLLLDEFDVLSEWSQHPEADLAVNALFPYLRKLLDTEQQLAFVFVIGRRLEDLPSILLRIFKGAQSERIWLLQREDAIKLIREPVQGKLVYQDGAIEAILDLTSGHPYFTQLICYALFNSVTHQERREVTAEDVPQVIADAMGTGETALAWLWDGFDPGTQLLVSAVAQLNKRAKKADIDSIKAILETERLKLPARDWRNALQDLVEWGLLERNRDGGYKFAVQLVQMWVVSKHPLSKMKAEETDNVKSFLEQGKQARKDGDFSTAVKFYREVLKANPNHLRAQLELATILLGNDQNLEAVKIYEDAYWQDPYSSREGLITARLAYAEDLEKHQKYSKAAVQYQKILEVDRVNRKVETKLDLLYRQGQAAYQRQEWAEAVRYFERVCNIEPTYEDVEKQLTRVQRMLKMSQKASTASKVRRAGWFIGGAAMALILGAISGLFFLGRGDTLLESMGLITRTPTPTSTITPTLAPTQTPDIRVVTATPTQTSTPTSQLTDTPTPVPSVTPTPLPTQTPDEPTFTPTPLIIVITATPLPPTSTLSPTLALIYDAPNLFAPENETTFGGRFANIELEWAPLPLRDDEFYSLSLRYLKDGELFYAGDEIRENSWLLPADFYFLQADSPDRRYEWDVTVYRRLPDGSTEAISPPSETRAFFWLE